MPVERPDGRAVITVLAGVNGAGKSSIGGAYLRSRGTAYYNPDEITRRLLEASPELSLQEANQTAWAMGKEGLTRAIAEKGRYSFETTLGGNTITSLLLKAAQNGAEVSVWYCGLESVDLHLERVARRVSKGGHDIPARKIRDRWERSRQNLIELLPFLTSLRVFDNSREAEDQADRLPNPRLLLEIRNKVMTFPDAAQIEDTPVWAKPVLAAAVHVYGMPG